MFDVSRTLDGCWSRLFHLNVFPSAYSRKGRRGGNAGAATLRLPMTAKGSVA